ncbi:MAG: hypothetical protein HOK28_00620, partial [Deltaproteobacteria bacterium]|nr:hypothetical protein [Deltaproteobacteria bacterium]
MNRSYLLLLLFLFPSGALAETPAIDVGSTTHEVVLDGVPNEKAWVDSTLLEGFTVFQPNTGIEKKFNARARVVIGLSKLYFFIEIDNGGADVFAPLASRDSSPGDSISVQIDPFGTGRRGYEFSVNAAGVLSDGRLRASGGYDGAWDSLFDAAVKHTERGWSAEMAVPFQSLRFDPKQAMWLSHIQAYSWAHQQGLSWAPIDRDKNNWLNQAGRISGFGGQEPGRDIELLPTVTTSWIEEEGEKPSCNYGADPGSVEICGAELEYGLGLKWGITSSLTFDAVFNPDFSQVEADPGILDLNSRFSIRLDERRPFFLEGADIFDTDFEVFYSRTIVQPEAAMKLTGKAGGFRLGVLSAIDPMEDGGYAMTEVGRVQADLGTDATVGLIVVERDEVVEGEHLLSNTVVGLDGQAYLMNRLNLEGELFMAALHEQGGSSNHRALDLAAKARAVWKTDDYRIQTRYRHVGEEFRSDAGFIPRTGYHEGFVKLDGYYRSDSAWARTVSPGLWTRYNVSEDGTLEDRVFGMNTYWSFGHRIWTFVKYEHNGELVRHEDDDGILLGSAWMEASDMTWDFGIDTLAWIGFRGGISLGQTPIRDSDLWSVAGRNSPFLGFFYSPSAELTLRPTLAIRLKVKYNHAMFLDGPQGELLGAQPRLRGELQVFINRDFNIRHITQWTDYNQELTNDMLL